MTDRQAYEASSSSGTATPVPDFDALDAQVAALAVTDPLLVDPAALPDGVARLQRIANQVGAIKSRWVAATEQRNSNGAERHSKWLSRHTGVDPDAAARETVAGKTIEQHQPVAQAASRGEISPDHARVIGRAAQQASPQHTDELVDELVGFAKGHTPEQTARHARKLAMRNADDQGLAQARSQLARRRFWFRDRRDGMVHGEGLFTPEVANKLKTVLEPFLGPDNDLPEDQRRSYPQRLHDAFGQVADAAINGDGLPQSRGLDTLAMVIVDYDWVTQGLDLDGLGRREDAGAVTFQGEPLSAETARRILCDAKICRVVTKGRTEVLDIGRATKVWPDSIRRAVYARDRGRCRRCGRPAQLVHHIRWWRYDGKTSVDNGCSLDLPCHLAVHEGKEAITINADGSTTFKPEHGPAFERPPP